MFDPGAEFFGCRPFLLLLAERKEFLQLQSELKGSQNQAGLPFAYQHCVFLAFFHIYVCRVHLSLGEKIEMSLTTFLKERKMKLNLKGQELEEETRWITELLIKSGAVAIPESEINISDIAHRDFIAFLPDEISRGVAAVLVVKSMVRNFLSGKPPIMDQDIRSFIESRWGPKEFRQTGADS
nr:MAG TPA: hypothetical protein [Caudoviricetes sp.]